MENLILYGALGLLTRLLIIALILLGTQRRRFTRDLEAQRDELLDALEQERDDHQRALRALNENLMHSLSTLGQSQSALLESMQRQVMLSGRNQEERFSQMSESTARGLENLRTSLPSQLTMLRQENDQQLSAIRRTVDEQLTQHLDKRLNASFAQVSARLEQVYKGLGEMQNLAVGVGDLKKVLTNVKTRGIWGEMQLGALLGQVLTREQYAENIEIVPGSQERVEFAVRLPGKDEHAVWLPIDSKFPQEDYLRLVEASQQGDAAGVETARRALMTRVKIEGKRIASKYIAPPHSTDFAIMFLPVEGLYAEVMRDMDTAEQLQREQRVVIAGPSTFAALLNALQMGFRTLAIEQRSSEVWKLLGAVKNDFGRFAEVLEKTQQRLRQASDSIDTAFTRTRAIQRRLGQVEAADAGLFTPDEPTLPEAENDTDQ